MSPKDTQPASALVIYPRHIDGWVNFDFRKTEDICIIIVKTRGYRFFYDHEEYLICPLKTYNQ